MADHVLPGQPPVPLLLRRSSRARRISLRVSQLDGRVTLTVPQGVPDREALAFADTKADWIRRHLSERREDVPVAIGADLPVEGEIRRIVPGPGRAVDLRPYEIAMPARGRTGPKLKAFLRELARARLVAASDHYAGQLGRAYSRITLRDTRSRWGSCSSRGGLMYSWRLVLAPPEILHYVAAHEVAHLAEMNHSPKFWRTVETLYGDHRRERKWLRENGHDLHRYRFDD
ncbi:MAG: SprT family zinc-dependent metalloprotease [Pseudomonadota bacterium]